MFVSLNASVIDLLTRHVRVVEREKLMRELVDAYLKQHGRDDLAQHAGFFGPGVWSVRHPNLWPVDTAQFNSFVEGSLASRFAAPGGAV